MCFGQLMKLFLHFCVFVCCCDVVWCGGGEGDGERGRWRWSVLLLLNLFCKQCACVVCFSFVVFKYLSSAKKRVSR